MAGWESVEERGGALYSEVLRLDPRGDDVAAWLRGVGEHDAATVGAATLLLIRRMATKGLPYRVIGVARQLSRRRCEVSREELLLAAQVVTTAPDLWQIGDASMMVTRLMVRSLAQPVTDPDVAEVVSVLAASVGKRTQMYASQRSTIRAKLLALLPASSEGGVDTTPIAGDDAWSAAVLPYLDSVTTGAGEVSVLIRHLAAATGSKPGKAWLAKAGTLLAAPAVQEALCFLVDRLADTERPTDPHDYMGVLGRENETFARAAVWALLGLASPPPVTLVQRIVERGMAYAYGGWSPINRVPNAAILVLGRLGTPEAVGTLQRLADSTTNNAYRKTIKAALAEAAVASGLQPGQLVERTVPDAGLDTDGTATLHAGTAEARVSLGDDLKLAMQWHSGDDLAAKPPAEADTSDVNAVKRRAKEIRDAIGTERRRLEGLLAVGREWKVADWRRYYLDHPVTGRFARQLLWTVIADGATHSGFPATTDKLSTLDGEIAVPDDATVRLWHPATASTGEVAAWRTWLVDNGARQPFKQAFREVYLLTPAEVTTGTYSNRFAAHILRYPQLYALFKERAWSANFLGPYYDGLEGMARRDLTDTGLTGVFEHRQADGGGHNPVDVCTTDRVWFFRTGDRAKRVVPLAEVPPLVFSEAMRDVDMFVSVTSIAADPHWADRGDHSYHDYWARTASADLTATARVRRDALARILPRLAVADRVELDDRHIRVRGRLASYRVHIGSGNILIEPDDRYLCIVPKRSRNAPVMLPFDGDDLLSQILSKIILLAADHRIKDPDIVWQLPRRD